MKTMQYRRFDPRRATWAAACLGSGSVLLWAAQAVPARSCGVLLVGLSLSVLSMCAYAWGRDQQQCQIPSAYRPKPPTNDLPRSHTYETRR